MATGIRVIRGPDWSGGDQDGGEGHVGTVVQYGTNGTAKVIWDNGKESMSKIGKSGKNELRILDSAPVGIRHMGVTCDVCTEQNVVGIRWKCTECDDYDLCSVCYSTDQHDLTHQFIRMDAEGATGERVPQRNKSMKVRAMGIYPGATVVRGRDWTKGDEDGGSGKEGTVTALVTPGSRSARSAVRVQWGSGPERTYRVGQDGKVEVRFTEEGPGIEYYPKHLPSLDLCSVPRCPSSATPASAAEEIKEGDKVCIELDEAALKELHKAAGSWSSGMARLIGKVGEVEGFALTGEVCVKFDSQKFRLLPGALRKLPRLAVGDTVQILNDEQKVRQLQEDHGGWLDDIKPYLGKKGRIAKIDSDGDVAVSFGLRTWLFNPACCVPAPGGGVDDVTDTAGQDETSAEELLNLPGALANLLAGLVIMRQAQQHSRREGVGLLFRAILEGDVSDVRKLCEHDSSLVNAGHKGIHPVHLAAHEGKLDMLKVLIDKGADINSPDNDEDTPLHIATVKQHSNIAEYLIRAGADLNRFNQRHRQPVHNAAYMGMTGVLRLLVAKGCDVNSPDRDGDTPIFDAIGKDQYEAVDVLLTSSKLDLTVANKRGFTPIHTAAFKGSARLAEKILGRNRGLVNLKKEDGFTALHLAAFNDHAEVARILISVGRADLNVQGTKGETPLHLACREAYLSPTQVLVKTGANVNVKDNQGNTPLHVLLMGNQEGALLRMLVGQPPKVDEESRVRIACYLLQHQADLTVKNNSDQTAMDICRSEKIKQAVRSFSQTSSSVGQASPQVTMSSQQVTLRSDDRGPKLCCKCMDVRANAIYLPCGHKETCRKCCVGVRTCGACGRDVTRKVTEDGNRIGKDCVIQ
ncbi:E3 ubiquitin-protein ligase MIB2-like [Haliotis rufescens]|uniref:E3 ubiquitin-protein ligase MIB2-like n=1 Tax=Haliotis rufescens TaxID=6454 RepID=UPI00201F111A|nr:E3 ubiquitin-protein ligase MIB2-like [Haliotis rufescens]